MQGILIFCTCKCEIVEFLLLLLFVSSNSAPGLLSADGPPRIIIPELAGGSACIWDPTRSGNCLLKVVGSWEGYTLYDSNYMPFWKRQNSGDSKKISGFGGSENTEWWSVGPGSVLACNMGLIPEKQEPQLSHRGPAPGRGSVKARKPTE